MLKPVILNSKNKHNRSKSILTYTSLKNVAKPNQNQRVVNP